VTLEQAVTHQPVWTMEDYVEQAGGFADRADRDRLLLLKPSARVVVLNDLDVTVEPGDEILVLPRIDNKTIQNAADIIDIIYKVAIAAAVAVDL
jgi:hypothetical protein